MRDPITTCGGPLSLRCRWYGPNHPVKNCSTYSLLILVMELIIHFTCCSSVMCGFGSGHKLNGFSTSVQCKHEQLISNGRQRALCELLLPSQMGS